jgi:hypothetical protein
VLLDNRYVFADFWQWQNGTLWGQGTYPVVK